MNSVNDIRAAFLDYFDKNDHQIVSSSSLVPRNDPTLMFTSAGMVQFKNVFTGLEKRAYDKAVTAQKCLRAGGKHNDLDNVGYTARHHTFFEMLGNFSFGDYFKEVAIELAWNLITKEFGLPPDRLLATVYVDDDVAFDLWKKIAGLSESRIIRIPTHDNFWAMGDTGPCGPCSEIFYDHGEHIPGGPPGSSDEDGDRFIEIWNLVFMQYEQITPDERIDLPRPSIDTGMGLERISALLQGTHDNYETDLFRTLIAASQEATGVAAENAHKASHRVIADHLRATSFMIADGVLPSNEGRGYVLRRIMRRAMRHGALLGAQEPLIYKLVPTLIGEMGQAYPELVRAENLISETLQLEEARFRKTLARGMHMLEDETRDLGAGDTLEGEIAFRLYDTYGFPLDLTEDALRERQIAVDTGGFAAAMGRQRALARKNWSGSGEAADERIWFDLYDEIGATDFLGYTSTQAEGLVKAIIVDGKPVERLETGEQGSIVVNQTPFYGESGGQVGDTGVLRASDPPLLFRVTNTFKKAGQVFVHEGRLEEGTLVPEAPLLLQVDALRRDQLRANHSATHLLHEALRQVLGTHVAQKGSLVAPDRLRFDFSHPKPLSHEERERVEDLANAVILQNSPVVTRLMQVDDAIAAGAMALFGEAYGDEVRVVSMGSACDDAGQESVYSRELCGGTHVTRTGDIGLVSIVSEGAVAAGVRRLEALTANAARHHLNTAQDLLSAATEALKVPQGALLERVTTMMRERKGLEKDLIEARKQASLAQAGARGGTGVQDGVETINGMKFFAQVVPGIPAKMLRGLVDESKQQLGSGVAVAITVTDDGKGALAVGVTEDLAATRNAVELVRKGAQALGGSGGGGRAEMAQAGGPDGARANEAIEAIRSALRK